MKTLHLTITVIFVTMLIMGTGVVTAQYGPGFSPVEHYPPTNDTALKLLVMNSTEFKERTIGYNYTLAGIDHNWISKGSNYYDFGGARVTFFVFGFENQTTKGDVFNIDSQMKIKNVFEYNADNPPPGYYIDRCMGCLLETNTKPKCCDPYVSKTLDTPLQQFKSGIKPEYVKCNQGLQLVIRTEDNSPACVKLDAAYMLIKRGWAASESAYPGGDAQFVSDTNSTIIPAHLPRSSGLRIPYYESSRVINYSGFDGMYNETFPYRGTQKDYVLKPGSTGVITFKLEAVSTEQQGQSYPIPLPKSLNLTNYAVFYHEITSLEDLSKYPGVTFSDNDHHGGFTACSKGPSGGGSCIGGPSDGTNSIEAFVTDHPGVDVLFEPPLEVLPLGMNTTSQVVTMMITADSNAPRGTYLVELPSIGLDSFLLTVGDQPYHE